MSDSRTSPAPQRLRIVIRGAVQGVGFRPFIYRLATQMQLAGWITNTGSGVCIEVQAQPETLTEFLMRIEREQPPRASIQSLESTILDPLDWSGFEIRESSEEGPKSVLVLPDIATCPDCLAELFDSSNRRFCYPFTNCTNCGPRFTIIESLPYDRPRTSMKDFPMCPDCEGEYHDPADRRFHAQPNACPACGPHLELWDAGGSSLSGPDQAILQATRALQAGAILAVKGIGGFHLVVDAAADDAVRRLRERKHREEKPFALMYPSVEAVRADCAVSQLEGRLLMSPESPIVLLNRRNASTASVSEDVAPRNPYLGVMLPYSPIHHLLLREFGRPIVATSGNLSDEPIAIDEHEALQRLGSIADLFLVHDRPIVRHVDDSVVRIMAGREMVVRRARGFAPLPVHLPHAATRTVLAVGAHLKSAIALSNGKNVFVSQHIGDLETKDSYEAFTRVIRDFGGLYESEPQEIVCDMHPEYLSTKFAHTLSKRPFPVQHHWAHVASCMAENELDGEVMGVSWDGTGFGTDGTIWGGEFLVAKGGSFERIGTLRPFRLAGADRAIKEPRRTALGLLAEIFPPEEFRSRDFFGAAPFAQGQVELLLQMIEKGLNAPWTSSVGRLFDGVASLAGLRHTVRYEGQAAMELEFALQAGGDDAYEFIVGRPERAAGGIHDFVLIDWEQVVRAVLDDRHKGVATGVIARRFHNALVALIARMAEIYDIPKIALTGGCFQNRYLTERAVEVLRAKGCQVYWHQRVPPNDGGIALGQIYARILEQRSTEQS